MRHIFLGYVVNNNTLKNGAQRYINFKYTQAYEIAECRDAARRVSTIPLPRPIGHPFPREGEFWDVRAAERTNEIMSVFFNELVDMLQGGKPSY